MKKIIFLISTFLFVGCGNNKQVDPALAGTITDPPTVKTDPAKFTLTVINKTDQYMKWEQSWAMTGPDSGIVGPGDKVELSSNEIDSDHINVYPIAPKSVDQPNPSNGTFSMQYGYDGHIARVYCDNACNKGYPTPAVHYEGTNWVYSAEWLLNPAVQTNTTNTVTITTEVWPIPKK